MLPVTPCNALSGRTALLVLLTASSLVLAQADSIESCKAIAEREARYACYDAVEAGPEARVEAGESPEAAVLRSTTVSAADPVQAPAVPAPAPAAGVPATPAQALDDFGKSPARLETDEAGEVALVDRVAGLKEVQFKQWQITLEGGQVWRQQLSQTFNLKEGYEVRITPINGGPNHRLSSPQLAGSIQVRRVR